MSRLTGGIGLQALAGGQSGSALVQAASCDPIDRFRTPPAQGLVAKRWLVWGLLGPKSVIAGITKNSSGAPLAGCTVKIYATATDTVRSDVTGAGVQVSDANGAYSFEMNDATTSYCRAYLPGAPDVAGTTVNTLVGS